MNRIIICNTTTISVAIMRRQFRTYGFLFCLLKKTATELLQLDVCHNKARHEGKVHAVHLSNQAPDSRDIFPHYQFALLTKTSRYSRIKTKQENSRVSLAEMYAMNQNGLQAKEVIRMDKKVH